MYSLNPDSKLRLPPVWFPQSVESLPDPSEKKLAKLRKKLEAIETLKERRERGEELEANQVSEGCVD